MHEQYINSGVFLGWWCFLGLIPVRGSQRMSWLFVRISSQHRSVYMYGVLLVCLQVGSTCSTFTDVVCQHCAICISAEHLPSLFTALCASVCAGQDRLVMHLMRVCCTDPAAAAKHLLEPQDTQSLTTNTLGSAGA